MATNVAHRPNRRSIETTSSVGASFETVVAILTDRPWAAFTDDPQAEPPVTVHLGGPAHLSRAVRLGWGRCFVDHDGAFALPVWWEAEAHPGAFPTFDGGLEIRRAGPDRAEVHLAGSYLPPLGVAGRFADQLLGHRVVCDSIERFLAEITTRLAAVARPSPLP